MSQKTLLSMIAMLCGFCLLRPGTAAPAEIRQDCGSNSNQPCPPKLSKKEQKNARHFYEQGLKLLKANNGREAIEPLSQATEIDRWNPRYALALELARQQAVEENLRTANQLLASGSKDGALEFYREALAIDPAHPAASKALIDAVAVLSPPKKLAISYSDTADQVVLRPSDKNASFHFRGDTRGLLDEICSQFGIKAVFADSFTGRAVRFDIDNANFAAALEVAQRMAKTFTVALDSTPVLLVPDTTENRRAYERLSLRIFRLPPTSSPQDFAEMFNTLRAIFDFNFLTPNASTSSITVRAPGPRIEAASNMLEQLSQGRPEVMLDIKAYELSHTFLRNVGVSLPLQYQILNVNTVLRSLQGTPGIQALINQLIASGTINQATATQIPALLAALAAQQNPILGQGAATFGGGITRFAVAIPSLATQLSRSESSAKTLEHITLRATDGNAATFRSGFRYPILNASFAPLAISPALTQVIGNQSFRPPFPSFSFEDLGLNLKATPQVHGQSEVTLNLDLQIRALGAESFNGIPVITNRQFTGTITLKNGEPAVVMGNFTHSTSDTKSGLPGLQSIPGLNLLTGTNQKQESDGELVVVVTPHILRAIDPQGIEAWLPK